MDNNSFNQWNKLINAMCCYVVIYMLHIYTNLYAFGCSLISICCCTDHRLIMIPTARLAVIIANILT